MRVAATASRQRARARSTPAAGGGALAVENLTKLYGDLLAVDGISLTVDAGEFVTLLGPSGSGKTTTLRMIAGFTQPTAGRILVDGVDLTSQRPYKRDIGMVFQNYALFPHMSALANVAFPLEMRRIPRREISRRAEEALKLVHLEGLGPRYPRQLSGGQQQRVALARALVFGPRLLLMDEPLGALDKGLREALQLQIKEVGREVGVTIVYVTHDQDEALVMSDRIAVFNRGTLEQVGQGQELYDAPASLFVATFMGESNVFHGTLGRRGEHGVVASDSITIPVSTAACARSGVADGQPVTVVVRPERIDLSSTETPARASEVDCAWLQGVVRETIYLGSARKYRVDIGGERLLWVRDQDAMTSPFEVGARVNVTWSAEDAILLPETSGTDDS